MSVAYMRNVYQPVYQPLSFCCAIDLWKVSVPRRNLFFSVLLFVVSHLLTLYTYSLH